MELIHNGRSFFSKNFLIKILYNKKTPQPSRFAVVVSKKISNKAVVRNFLKRRVKYALIKRSLDIKDGFQVVIWLKNNLSETKYNDFEAEIIKLLNQTDILNA